MPENVLVQLVHSLVRNMAMEKSKQGAFQNVSSNSKTQLFEIKYLINGKYLKAGGTVV